MVYVFLADGFEIIEALSPVDMLRRADIETVTVGVTGKTVESSCGVTVTADIILDELEYKDVEAIILPGGAVGVENLEKDSRVQAIIDKAYEDGIYICAICAAPSILGNKGLLNGVKATSYPSFMKYLSGAEIPEDFVICDGRFITARGAGVSVDFGMKIVEMLRGKEISNNIRKSIQCH